MRRIRAQPPREPERSGVSEALAASAAVLADEERVEQVALSGVVPPEHHARWVTITDGFVTAALAGVRLPDLHLRDCVVAGADWANLFAPRADVERSTFEHVRLTGATLAEGALRDVRLTECRLDLVSLAGAKIERVVFVGCDLREASLDEAQLRDVRFERCDVSGLSLARARLERVEIVGCELAGVRSVADLRGALMPWDDLVGNAGALAAALGIGLLEEGER